MNNAELIKVLRYCVNERTTCTNCDYYGKEPLCQDALMNDAADALEAAEKRIAVLNTKCADLQSQINSMENEIEELIPKEGEWMRTDAFPHRIYCSVCYKTYVPNDRCEIWVDEYLPRRFCPNCGARMRGEHDGES